MSGNRETRLVVAAALAAAAVIVAAASISYWYASPSNSALQFIAGEIFKASLGFILVAIAGALVKATIDADLEKRKNDRAAESALKDKSRAKLEAWEERKRQLLHELASVFSGFYTVRKLYHSLTSRRGTLYPAGDNETLKIKRDLLRECVELEGRYGAFKIQALLLLQLPTGDLGWKPLDELAQKVAAETDPRRALRLRFDLLGETFDGWRHALEKNAKIETAPTAWEQYEYLLAHLTHAEYIAAPPCD